MSAESLSHQNRMDPYVLLYGIVWNLTKNKEEASHLIIPLGKGEAYASRSVYARSRPSRVYVFTPLPPLLAPLYGTDTFTRISIFTSVD
jgi:hypothetical protein